MEFNENEIKFLKRAVFNERLHSLERITAYTEDFSDYYTNLITQECEEIKILNGILSKLFSVVSEE